MTGTVVRGKLTRGDLALYDGKTSTYSRPDATGGTTTGLRVGNEVDVLQVYGAGTARTRATIADAVQQLGTTAATLSFAPGTWSIDDNLTIPSNIVCRVPAGCVFSVDSGKTLTFAGRVEVDYAAVWTSGAGSIVVSAEGLHGATIHRTAKEKLAGVTPTLPFFVEGYYKRYGIAGDATTNDTTALANMLKVGYQGVHLDFGSDIVIMTDTFSMKAANLNVPPSIVGHNVTIRARSGASGVFVTLENPHDVYENFSWTGAFTFDANSLCTSAFLLHGSQRCCYGSFKFIKTVGGPQCRVEAEADYGIFSNVFYHWVAGGLVADGGDDDGFSIKSTDGSNRIAANLWIQPTSTWNVGRGFDFDHCSDTFDAPRAERNDDVGFYIDNTVSMTFNGGYSENNDVGMSGGGADDLSGDESFTLTANSNHVMIFGGRHIGTIVGDALGNDHTLMPGTGAGLSFSLKGIGIGGGNPVDNGINFLDTDDIRFRAGGANKLGWITADDRLRSFVQHLFSAGALVAASGTKDTTAALEVASTTQTLLIPRMTTTQQNAITSPPNGSVLYNTTTDKLMVRTAGVWTAQT